MSGHPEGFTRPPDRIDGFLPLRAYALIGDGRSCALVGADGAVDWWALPMHADPTFGAVLDPVRGGRLTMRPVDDFEMTRSYVEGGAVLGTHFKTAAGTVRVTDALTLGAGSLLPWTEFARRIDAVHGEVRMRWEVTPGEGFDRTAAWPRLFDRIPLISSGDKHFALVLDQVGEPTPTGGGFCGEFTARPGTPALLSIVSTAAEPTPVPSVAAILRRVDETTAHWAGWAQLVDYDGPWAEAVGRSALVHKQLTLTATGGLQAAATTSLPERIGASRNFDYRFSWVRDTGFALDALTSIGLRGEVHTTLCYLLRAVASTAPDVRVFYSMTGAAVPATMASVPLWTGYRSSAPVQIGNSAAAQRQLGTYGDLLEAIARYAHQGNILDGASGRLVVGLIDRLCAQWTEADAGLWELGEQKPYTSSKIGCWAALDRAIKLAEGGQIPADRVECWRATAEEIHRYVDELCWSQSKGSYTFYAGTEDLDCATLLAARTGFCAGDDPRLHGTIDAIRAELSAGGPLLYRYTGMRGQEGAFVACSFWLAEALTVAGRLDEAREVMDAAVDQANDVGLFTEEIDPDSGALLGNMPQTLSHLALISAATRYHQATVSHGQRGQ